MDKTSPDDVGQQGKQAEYSESKESYYATDQWGTILIDDKS